MYTFTEPLSIGGLLLSFLVILVVLVYGTYFFYRRKKILELRKLPTMLIVGMSNTGKTFLIKALSENKPVFFDKILSLNYIDLDYNGKFVARILDHIAFSSLQQSIDRNIVNEIKNIDPLAIIGVIDVSKYSEPLEKQVRFISRMKEFFRDKPFFIVANKIDETSESKVKKIEKQFGKVYKVRWNVAEDVYTLKRDLFENLKKTLKE